MYQVLQSPVLPLPLAIKDQQETQIVILVKELTVLQRTRS